MGLKKESSFQFCNNLSLVWLERTSRPKLQAFFRNENVCPGTENLKSFAYDVPLISAVMNTLSLVRRKARVRNPGQPSK